MKNYLETIFMHACEMVELAALISAHGPALIIGTSPISLSGLDEYWATSKCRFDRWNQSFRNFQAASSDAKLHPPGEKWESLPGLLEEVFSSEILTRIWTAVLAGHDRHHGNEDAELVAHGILLAHMESRNRTLKLLMSSTLISAEESVELNRLRRKAERWTDLLIGYLLVAYDVSEFAFEPARAKEFAEELQYKDEMTNSPEAWKLVTGALRESFRRRFSTTSPNGDLNARIALSVMNCFQAELRDSVGMFKSPWMTRILEATDDAECMIQELFAAERRLVDLKTGSQLSNSTFKTHPRWHFWG